MKTVETNSKLKKKKKEKVINEKQFKKLEKIKSGKI